MLWSLKKHFQMVIFVLPLFLIYVLPASAKLKQHHEDQSWKLVTEKTYSSFRVALYQKEETKIVSSKLIVSSIEGEKLEEIEGTFFETDPKKFVQDFDGSPIDFDQDGISDLMVQEYSGGSHCCYSYYFFHSGKKIKSAGKISLKDCGEKIVYVDLDGDNRREVLTCSALFTYLGHQDYSLSPFPPMIFSWNGKSFVQNDKKFSDIFEQDAERQKEFLNKEYDPKAALQLVVDYLLIGKKRDAWQILDENYRGSDRAEIKSQLQKRLK